MAQGLSREDKQGLTLIGLPFGYALIMLAAPLAMVLAFSFWTQNYLDIDRTLTLENYKAVFSQPIYQTLLWRSLRISLIVTVVTVVLAFPIAYYLSFHVKRNKALWLF